MAIRESGNQDAEYQGIRMSEKRKVQKGKIDLIF